jgi:class 3 adenylate cyclase/pimeloyl-ACP methyl ester carboxylesterase
MFVVPDVQYVVARGRAVAYQRWGDGAVDVLVMSDWTTSVDNVWEHPGRVRLLGYLGEGGRVVRFDCPGVGGSDPVPYESCGDLDDWTDAAVAVLDAVGAERAVVIGEGFAGHAAISLAASRRERVERLVLVNSFARYVDPELVEDALSAIVPMVQGRWGTGELTSGGRLGKGAPDPGFCGRSERLAASPSVAAAFARASIRSDVRPLLPKVDVPTLVMFTGDLWFWYSTREHSEDLATHISNARLIDIETSSFYWGDRGLGEFGEFVSGKPRDAAGSRELATVLFTDIVDSTRLAADWGDRRWRAVLDNIDRYVATRVQRCGGRIVKQTGDGHLAVFTSPQHALDAAIGIMRASPTLEVVFRMGLHTGEIELRDGGDIGGIAVHVAARVASLAHANDILVSRTIADLLAGSTTRFSERGEYELKGLPGRWQLFATNTENDPPRDPAGTVP